MLAQVWLGFVALALAFYVVLDGFDLGIGVLLLFDRDDRRRKTMVELVATAWDGNESWIVLVGVALFGGMPLAYGALLPATYIPLIVMLFALILRGFSIEMQSARPGYDRRWGAAFGWGSLVAALCQGLVLGRVLSGVALDAAHRFVGSTWDFLTWRAVLVAIGVLMFYTLAGAAWLRYRTAGVLQRRAGRYGLVLAPAAGGVALLTAFVLAATHGAPVDLSAGARPWLLSIAGLAGVAGIVYAAIGFAGDASASGSAGGLAGPRSPVPNVRVRHGQPFWGVVVAELAALVAVATSMLPYLLPPSLTLDQAAAPEGSLRFLVIGVGICIPIILAYNGYAYWVFRGTFTLPDAEWPAPPDPGTGLGVGIDTDHAIVTASPYAPVHRSIGHWLVNAVWVVVTPAAALVSIDVLGGYSVWYTYAGLAVFSLLGLYAWWRSDRDGDGGGSQVPDLSGASTAKA